MKFKHFVANVIKIHHEIQKDKPLLLRISTMTVMGGREGAKTPLDIYKNFFSEPKQGWTLKNKSFNNSVTVMKVVENYKKRSVKFFPNGLIHVTGCSTPMESEKIVKEIQNLVDPLFEGISDFKCIDIQTQMINATFKVPHLIDQLALVEHYKRFKGIVTQSSFHPETYSAVKARIYGLSVSVFKTGSIVLSGAKDLESLVKTYHFLLNAILYEPDVMEEKTTIREKDPQHFYQTEVFINKIKKVYNIFIYGNTKTECHRD